MKKQKQEDFVFAYVNRDSQRLRETFFTDNKKKSYADNRLFFILAAAAVFLTVSAIIVSHYDVIMVKRANVEIPSTSVSLLKRQIAQLTPAKKDDVEKRTGLLYMAIPAANQAGFRYTFSKPRNLFGNVLIMYLKTDKPLIIDIVAKDTGYYSNANAPFMVKVEPSLNNNYQKVSFEFRSQYFSRANLSSISQLAFYLRPINNEGSRVLVKDILIAEKE